MGNATVEPVQEQEADTPDVRLYRLEDFSESGEPIPAGRYIVSFGGLPDGEPSTVMAVTLEKGAPSSFMREVRAIVEEVYRG